MALFIVFAVIVLAAMVSSFRVVPQDTAFVVERLGKFYQVFGPGYHFLVPFLDKVSAKVSTAEQLSDIDTSGVVTADGQIVYRGMLVFYKVEAPEVFAYAEAPVSAVTRTAEIELNERLAGMDQNAANSGKQKLISQITAVVSKEAKVYGINVSRIELR